MSTIEIPAERLAVTIAEAARMTTLSRSSLRNYAKTGTLRTAKVGRRILIPLSALHELMRRGAPSQR
jgi:excisionase family DNA binding protein